MTGSYGGRRVEELDGISREYEETKVKRRGREKLELYATGDPRLAVQLQNHAKKR